MKVDIKDITKMTTGIDILYDENKQLRKAVQFLTLASLGLFAGVIALSYHIFVNPLF